MDEDQKDVKPDVTVASQVSFTELCGLLEKISRTQGNDKKKKFLKDFIDKWREFHDKIHDKETVFNCLDNDWQDTYSGSICNFYWNRKGRISSQH